MTARPCLPWPHPLLRARAAEVPAITDEVRAIWRDMVDTMEAMPGYGLAAPQIGVGLRLAVVDCSERRGQAVLMANPVVLHASVHLREHEGCARVGIVGFCMGGALAVIGASVTAVDAYVSFYGFPPEGSCNLAKVVSPGLLLFGEHEEFFDVPQAREFVAAQNARGVATELVVYPSAGHAFFNDHRPEVFEPAAAQDAWRRTTAFFDRVLRG